MKIGKRENVCKFVSSWWNMLYPRVCVICEDALVDGEKFLCTRCLSTVPLNEGVEYSSVEEMREYLGVENIYWLFHYDHHNQFQRWIYAIKYRSKKNFAKWSGKMLGERMGDASGIDCVIPVPLHPKKEKERGYNQALLIGMGVAEVLGVPVETDVIRKIVNTRSQAGLSGEQRMDHLKDSFALNDLGRWYGCHTLLVDDVITTGATIRACMDVLEKIPGLRVSVACLGKSGGI